MEKKEKGWLKRILKPNPLKIIMFVILLILMIFLPLYPAHTEEQANMNGYIEYKNYTSFQSLITVIDGNFEWVTYESAGLMMVPAMTGIWTGSYYFNEAEPFFLVLYIPFTIITYILACLISDYVIWIRNNRKGLKDL